MDLNDLFDMDHPDDGINQALLDREVYQPFFHNKKELLIVSQDCPSNIKGADINYQDKTCELGEENHHDLDHDFLPTQFIKTKNKELSEEPCGNSSISFS